MRTGSASEPGARRRAAPAPARGSGAAEAAAVEEALVRLLRRVNHPRVHAHLEDEAGCTLERSHYVVLARVEDAEGMRLSELAAVVGIDLSTASRHVARLEALGLLRRRSDPDDRRASVLALTPAGADVLGRFRGARHAWFRQVLGGWAPADRADLARLLGMLADAMPEPVAPGRPARAS